MKTSKPSYYMFEPVKPPHYYRHYSNPDCQGSLIEETPDFPDRWYPKSDEVHSIYLDRIGYYGRYETLIASGLHKAAEECIQRASEDKAWVDSTIKRIKHVRLIYYFNVATGYDCPCIVIVCSKPKRKAPPKMGE